MERDEWEDFVNFVDNLIKGKSDKPDPPAPKQDLKTTPSGDEKPVKITMSSDGKYTTQTSYPKESCTRREPEKRHGEHLPRYVGKVRCLDSAGDRCQLFVRVDDPEKDSPKDLAVIHIGFTLDGDAETSEDYYLDITADQSLALRSMLEQAEYFSIVGDVTDTE